MLKNLLPKSIIGNISTYFPARKSYGASGEDIIAKNLLRSIDKGFYVDIGCFHPVVANNTFIFYKSGWSGINIDADQYKIEIFNKTRKRDINLCSVISDKEEEVNFYFQPQNSYGSMNSIIKSEAERKATQLGRELDIRKVKTVPLSSIFRKENVKKIDFLTIDVEGAEEKVLSTIDFKEIEIGVIAVEIHGSFKEIENSAVNKLLISNLFEFVAWTPPTVFYKKI